MNWLSILGIAVLLLSIQYDLVDSASSISPWAEPASARSFMNCLLAKIAGSNVLPMQEKEDLKSIMDTLMSVVNEANARGKSSGAQLKAINMAIASSLAEIVVAEDVGNQASIAVKTQALSGALEQCFQLVMGTVDRKFINEINDLISMFAKEAASEEVAQNQGGFSADGPLSLSSFQITSQSADNAYQSSETMQGSIQTAGGYRRGYSRNQAPQTSLSSLQTTNQSSDNNYQLGETFQGSTKMAGGYRRGYSGNQVQQPALSSFQTTSQSSGNIYQSSATLQGSAKTAGGYGRGYSGVQASKTIPIRDRPLISRYERIGVKPHISKVASDFLKSDSSLTSFSQTTDSTKNVADSTTVSYSRGYHVVPDAGNLRGPLAPIDNSLVGGGQQAGLISRVANVLANSSTMKAVLRRGVSQKTVYKLIRRTIQSIAKNLGVDKNTFSRKAIQAISKIAPGSDTLAYAQVLSNALVSSGILNERNIDSMGPRVLSAVLNGLSSAGQGLGINANNGNVQNDIQSSSGFLTTTSSVTSFSQSDDSTKTSEAPKTSGYPVGTLAGTVEPKVHSTVRGGTQDGLISRVTNALMSSATFRAMLRRSVPPQAALNLIQRTVQSLANTFGVEGNNFSRIALQGISQLSPRSGTPSYAQVLSTALVTGGILNESNIDSVGPKVLSAILNSLSNARQSLDINMNNGNGQNNIQTSNDFQTTSSSTTTISQSEGSTTTGAISTAGGYPVGTSLGGSVASAVDSVVRGGSQAGLISKVANALVNSPKFRTLLRGGVPPQTSYNLIQRTVQSLANTFGVDRNNFDRIVFQAISELSPRSDTPTYAQVLATALVTGDILNEINIESFGPQVLSAVLNALSSAGQGLDINVDSSNVQNDIGSASSSHITSSSSNSFFQSGGSATNGVTSTTVGYLEGTSGGPAAPTVDSSAREVPKAGLVSRVTNALVNSSTFRSLLKSGVTPQTASNLVQRTMQSLANTFRADGNNFGRIALQSISQLSPRSDPASYAEVFSTALVTGGVLDESNIDTVGPQVLSAVLNALSSAGQGLGINVDNENLQIDVQSRSGSQATISSSSSFSQSGGSTITGATSTTGGSPVGSLGGNAPQTIDSSIRAGQPTGLISRVINALANSPTFRALLRRGVPSQTASSLIQRSVQSLADTFNIDANSLVRIALHGISQLTPRSDTPDYAQVLATALVTGGILNESNIDSVGPQVLSVVLNGLSTSGQGIGINVNNVNVQNDQQFTTGIQTASSSSSGFSQSDVSASTTGAITVGTLGSPVPEVTDSSIRGVPQTGLISRVANALVNSPTFRTVLRRGVPAQTATNLIQRTVKSLADTPGVDGNSFRKIAIQATSQLSPRSETHDYAQILATALVNGGILNESNIDSVGSQVLSAVLNGLSSAEQGLRINVGNVQNDIQSSSGFQRTSSSSNSFSSANKNADSTSSGYPGGYPVGTLGGSVAPTINFSDRDDPQAGLISRVANALVNSSTFRAHFRKGVSLQTASNLIQRTVQLLSNTIRVDGNNLGRIALQAIAQLGFDSDTPSYAQVLSTALVTGGVLNESNIDSVGPQVFSAILDGLSSAGQVLGINTDAGNVEIDSRSSRGYMNTSSSTSFSETDNETSTGLTRVSGYTPGAEPSVGGQQFDSFADQTSVVESSSNQGGFSQSSGSASSVTNQGFRETSSIVSSGAEPSLEISVLSSLNSPNGLRSGSAEARISLLASSILNSISPVGVDADILARSLQASVSNLRSSGMSSNDAKIEVLLETIVGLLQLLSNAQVRGLNTTTASAVTSSAARSFELALAK